MAETLLYFAALLLLCLAAFAYALDRLRRNTELLIRRSERRLKDLEAAHGHIEKDAAQIRDGLEAKTADRDARDKDFDVVTAHAAEIAASMRE